MASRTVPPQWRRAFLRALAVTANITLSARRAGIDKSTAYHARKQSPLFGRLWAQALADGRAALGRGRIPTEATDLDPRPLSVRSSKSGRVCVMATGEGRWNAEVEAEFFAVLAATGNVNAAARAIGMSTTALYKRCKLWPAFAGRWDEVISQASQNLALQLLTSAANMVDTQEPAAAPGFDMSVDQAIRVAQLYEGRRQKNGTAKRNDAKPAPVDVEAIKADIVRKARLLSRGGAPDE